MLNNYTVLWWRSMLIQIWEDRHHAVHIAGDICMVGGEIDSPLAKFPGCSWSNTESNCLLGQIPFSQSSVYPPKLPHTHIYIYTYTYIYIYMYIYISSYIPVYCVENLINTWINAVPLICPGQTSIVIAFPTSAIIRHLWWGCFGWLKLSQSLQKLAPQIIGWFSNPPNCNYTIVHP